MNLPSATMVLGDRRRAFGERTQRLRLAQGPPLTAALTWPVFWDRINPILRTCGYKRSTRRQYRHILRALRRHGIHRPADVTATRVRTFIHALRPAEVSWSWIALNIAVLRTVFDRICGLAVTDGLVTPKRGWHLPEILSESEAEHLVQSARTVRDQLLMGLLYGCGLTGSEASALRWRDVREGGRRLHVCGSTRYLERVQHVPEPLRELLRIGAQTCSEDDYIFRGRAQGSPLSARMVQTILRRACRQAGIARPICVLSLRHSYAVRRLENGINLRELQHELGHASIRTTQRYPPCLAPKLESHPLSDIRRRMRAERAHTDTDVSHPPVSKGRPPTTARPLAGLKTVSLRALRLPFDPVQGASRATLFLRFLTSRLFGGLIKRTVVRTP